MTSQNNLISRTQISEQVNGTSRTVQYQGKLWQTVHSKIDFVSHANRRWVSMGGGTLRERLFFDSNSPLVKGLKEEITQQCHGKSIQECLQIVNRAINSLNGSPDIVSEEEVKRGSDLDRFIQSQKIKQNNCNPIDLGIEKFVEKKLLVCRHKGLLAASILAHLVKHHILPIGKVRQYRSTLRHGKKEYGAHTWAVYRDVNGQLWICDPQWDIVAKTHDPASVSILEGYGDATLNEMVKRMDSEDILKPLVHALNKNLRSFNVSVYIDLCESAVVLTTRNYKFKQILKDVLEQHAVCFEEKSDNGKKIIIIKKQGNEKLFSLNLKQFINDCTRRIKDVSQSTANKKKDPLGMQEPSKFQTAHFLPAFQNTHTTVGYWKMTIQSNSKKSAADNHHVNLLNQAPSTHSAKNTPLLRPPFGRP